MKKLAKVAASLFLSFVMLTACMPSVAVHAEAAFVPRLTAPSSDNPYYFSDLNLYYRYGYGMPNCTAYAYGRVYEILGHEPNVSRWNAGQWWFDNMNYGWYSYGSTPRQGAVICWDRWDENTGHVAVVEEVYGNGTILISESSWGGTMFRTRVINADSSNYLTGYRFLGYIYACEGAGVGGGAGNDTSVDNSAEEEQTVVRPVLSRGSYGSAVSELQQRLYDLGFLDIAPDADFGYITERAVLEFQRVNGIIVDGMVGSETWGKLYSDDVIGANGKNESQEGNESSGSQEENGTSGSNSNTLDPSSMPTLQWGSNNDSVIVLQNVLDAKGYECGGADGFYGNLTYGAVTAYQRDRKLDVDGIVGFYTWSSLAEDDSESNAVETVPPVEENVSDETGTNLDPNSMPWLSIWCEGEDVELLQTLLNEKGFDSGSVDGLFGWVTYSAVVEFQSANGLIVDGVVGDMTWTALLK